MSKMILHDKKNNDWSSLGLGILNEAINPKVTKERHGVFELSFEYPINAVLFNELEIGRWIVADTGKNTTSKKQRFEIATISKKSNGIVEVYCEHYRYQLGKTIVKIASPIHNIPAQTALNTLKSTMLPQGEFQFFSDITTRSSIDLSDPTKFKHAQEVLGGVRGSILDNFGGEYLFDNNTVKLLESAGRETNIIIAYGKNLTDVTQEDNIANTYTSVYGFSKDWENDKILTLPETYIDSDHVDNYTQRRIQMVDFTEDDPKSVEALRNLVKAYIKNNNVGIPNVSLKASFEDLSSAVSDENLHHLDDLDLCDKVTVLFEELGVHTDAKIIKVVWDVEKDVYQSVELGEFKTNFTSIIDDTNKKTDEVSKKTDWLEQAQKEASDILKNPGKGHVVIYPSLADPQELLIMDTTNVNTARNVWRWNVGGLGFSSTGYNGTYGLAMTNNGAIVADRMTTGVLKAISIMGVDITGSVVTSENGYNKVIMNNGTLYTYYNRILRSGLTPTEFFVNDENAVKMMQLNSSGVRINKSGTTTRLGYLGRGIDAVTKKEELAFNVDYGNIGSLAVQSTANSNYIRKVAVSSAGTSISNLIMGGDYVGGTRVIKNGILDTTSVSSSFVVNNNVALNFYSNLNMNGWSIFNQSDIRLKENIEDTAINGIEETKKLNFVEFNRKQNYKTTDQTRQPNSAKELGLIAQYTPFLMVENAEDDKEHYLSLDVNKQIMLNSLTNKQLIEIVEKQEERIRKIEEWIESNEK